MKTGLLVRVRHAQQQAAPLPVEVVGGGEVDGERNDLGQLGKRLREDDLAAHGGDRQGGVHHLPERARPGARGTDDGAGGDRATIGVHGAGFTVGDVDAGDVDAGEQGGAVPAGARRVAEHDGLRRAVAVVGGVGRGEQPFGLDQRGQRLGLGDVDHPGGDAELVLQRDVALGRRRRARGSDSRNR